MPDYIYIADKRYVGEFVKKNGELIFEGVQDVEWARRQRWAPAEFVASSGIDGIIYSVVPEAIGDLFYAFGILGKKNSELLKTITNLTLLYFTGGSWPAVLAAMATEKTLEKFGFSRINSRCIANGAALATSLLVQNDLSAHVATKCLVTTAFLVGEKIGFWAEKKIAQRFIKDENIDETSSARETPQLIN